ncbi:unnamed protein product [Brassica napus]|uniref:(rape) hypothetical protein n=1 Tax=Brassica napus TaxID=3708 RepID=A0A816M0R7_BRANA|nr:unnamed protein product [Brassica napus]
MAGDVGETNDRFFKSGEAAVDQEAKIVVPPRKEPEVEKKTKPEHEHESDLNVIMFDCCEESLVFSL